MVVVQSVQSSSNKIDRIPNHKILNIIIIIKVRFCLPGQASCDRVCQMQSECEVL